MASDQTIQGQLNTHARQSPEAIAIAAPGRLPLTYRQLQLQIKYTARYLNSIGIGRNDPVAVVLPNGPEMAAAFVAIAAAATSAPLNPAYRTDEFDFYLSDLRARALLVQTGLGAEARDVARARNIPIIELSPALEAEAGSYSLSSNSRGRQKNDGPAESDDRAMVLHTSGTTSRPKLVPLTQINLWASARNIATTLQLDRNDRCLNVMPLFHVHGPNEAVYVK